MSLPRAAHRNYPRQFGGGSCRILRVLRRKQWVEDFRYVALENMYYCALEPWPIMPPRPLVPPPIMPP